MPTFYPGQTDYLDQLNALVALTGPGSGQFLAGTAGAPSITFATSTQSGWYLDAVNQPALATSGVRRLFVTAAGLLTVSSGATITGNFTTSGPTNATNIASDQTSGVLNFGSASGTGTITLGQSTGAQTVGVATGVTVSGTTKTLNLGTGGASGSVTNITLGSLLGTTAVGIGTAPTASAVLDIQSTTRGVRFPNMTTTQKNAVASPLAGLIVFDTTLAKLCVYSGSAWQTITSV
jgi:hypothetical protein